MVVLFAKHRTGRNTVIILRNVSFLWRKISPNSEEKRHFQHFYVVFQRKVDLTVFAIKNYHAN